MNVVLPLRLEGHKVTLMKFEQFSENIFEESEIEAIDIRDTFVTLSVFRAFVAYRKILLGKN